MGWLILSLALFILSVVLLAIDWKKNWDSVAIEMPGLFTALVGLAASVIIAICMIDVKDSANVTIAEYNNIVELTNDLGVPSDALMEKTIKLNETILDHRIRLESFWTKGLYSEDVAALPLLEVPEVMKNVDTD